MRLLTTLLIFYMFTSCRDKVHNEKLPGRYVFTNWSRDTINIHNDGTYRHYTIIDGKRLENSGTWKLNSLQNEIQFKDFHFFNDALPKGNWFSRLRLEGEEIQLMYANDINAYYKKIHEFDSLSENVQ